MKTKPAVRKRSGMKRWRTLLFCALLVSALTVPQGVRAAGFFGANNNHFTNFGAPAADALPQLKAIIQGVSGVEETASENKLEIHQDEETAIIEWDSFDIGEDAWTHFDQQGNSDWVALNRIFDKSPSQIYGRLTADGKIYLINQNGILFGSSARVNVHSLVATSLNIDDDLIGGGTLRFEAEDYRDPLDLDPEDEIFTWVENVDGDMVPLPGPVVNWAVSSSDSDIGIHVDDAGTVLLIAPEVVNRGLIIAPSGQIALAAGREVEVMALEDRTLPHVFVGESVALKDPGNTGVAVNSSAGLLVADAGVAGMYGRIVRQEGLIRSVTAVEAGGTIELLASEGVLLGSLSLTATPITDDTETYHQSYEGAKGSIIIGGLGTTTESNDGSIVFKATATERILHQGEILAPCGAVDMSATGWIYLDTESRIDVSGEWVQVSADASIIGLQLNSMELKNDYGQQDSVLQGQEVQIIGYAGSTIGDASEALTSEYLSALEMNAAGGDITIHGDDDTSLQEFIMREGAVIDIAGGGTIYTEGHYDGTKLLAGNQVYDISLAPEWYEYEKILGSQETEHERFGLTEYFEGLYLGGASPVSDFLSSYVAGEDAGSLTVEARGVVLNGTLIASAQAGLYQTELAVTEEQIGEFYLELTQGTQLSRGGQLVLGVEDDPADDDPYDLVLDEVVITAESALLDEDFEPGDELRGSSAGETSQTSYYADKNGDPLYRTVLSTDTLNNSGLSDIRIYSNTSVTIEEDALLTLSPGGYLIDESVDYQTTMAVQYDTLYGEDPATLTIWARAFENLGTVAIPSGNISVALKDTVLANGEADTVIELPSRAYFDDGSTMSTDGERINNLYAGELGSVETGFIDGGEISISNDTQHGAEIIIRSGAVLDVSAGYELDSEGTLTAGTAGALSLESSSILLDGDLRGYALSGYDGGSLTLHATRITVSTETPGSLSKDFDNDSEIPEERKEHLVLGQDQLADTGFSSITLKSFEDLTFEDGVVFTPSDVRLALPGPEATLLSSFGLSNYSGGSEETEAALLSQGLVRVSSEVMGATLIAAMAGEGVTRSHKDDDEDFIKSGQYPRVIVPGGVRLETAPQGEIVLSSVGLLFLEGMLEAPAGSMELTSRLDDIHLAGISSILAKGVNIPEETALISGLPVGYTALDGGTVTLSATAGAVTMDPGAIIDVSGSEPVETLVLGAGNTLETDTIASDSGALEIAFRTDLILNGTIEGEAALSESLGASLVLSRHGEGNTLLLDQDLFDLFIGSGFDSYTFQSEEGILFSEALDLDLGRYLELDAPLITGLASLGDQAIRLSATDVVLCNTREKYIDESSNASESNLVTDETELIAGDATLALSGDWIDIEGAVAIQGFGDVSLEAVWDIRVLDEEYLNTDTSTEYRWAGELRTRGDLTLKASRIYPAMKEVTSSDGDRVLTPTAFVIRSDTGTVTILPGEEALEDPILSAGGVLAVVAPEIEHYGYLAAPLGQIVLVAAPLVEDGGDLIPARDVAITAEDGLYNVDIKVLVDSLGGAYGSVVLGSESVTTTHSDTEVSYGLLTGTSWKLPNKSRGLVIRSLDPNDWPDVSASPETGVIVRASGIDFQEGALIDASGGGGLYAYEFQAGIEGLSNPLEVEGRYVIVPGTSYSGEAVYLAGGGSLPKGVYTLLPAEYAFLPGAYVIEDLGTTSSLEKVVRTEEGYTAVLGYETETGTGARSSQYHRYAVRSAQDVLQEGTFQIAESITGSAGTVSLVAETLTLSGTIELTSLPLFQGGVIELSASRISIGTSTDGFDASLQLDHSLFENMDLEEIRIGVLSTTERDLVDELETEEIHVYEGQTSAPTVTLTASQDVILNDGAEIHAVDESVTVTELTYQYTYDPEVGLGIMSPSEIHRIGDGEDVAGTMMRRTAEGGVALQFYTEDGSFKWVAEQDDPDLEGLGLSAMSLTEEELTALLDLIPEEFNLGYALPYGKAELYSRDGDIVLHEGSLIHATDEVVLDGQVDLRGGRIESDNGALTLAGKNIYFVTDIDSITRENGVYLDTELFDALNSFRHLTLRSGRYADTDGDGEPDSLVEGGDLVFEGGFDLRPAHDLTLQAARIAGLSTGGAGEETTIYGETLHIVGTSSNWVYEAGRVSPDLDGAYTLEDPDDLNGIVLYATSEMIIGGGHLVLDGFDDILLASDTALTFQGEGSLTADFDADYDSGDGSPTLTLEAPVVTAGTGASLVFEAETIEHDGTLDVPGGDITLSATGDIDLADGSEILAQGGIFTCALGSAEDDETYEATDFRIVAGAYTSTEEAATDRKGLIRIQGGGGSAGSGSSDGEESTVDVFQGGSVTVESDQGEVHREGSALIDVSNDDRTAQEIVDLLGEEQAERLAESGLLDAGTVTITVPGSQSSGLNLSDWNVLGGSAMGAGGAFSLTVLSLTSEEMGTLSARLQEGGFTRGVGIRTESGGLTLEAGDTLTANQIRLVAAGGDLTISGTIEAVTDSVSSITDAGLVELYAWNDLTIGGTIDASNTMGDGGEVYLYAGHVDEDSWSASDPVGSGVGQLTLGSNALIDVQGEGQGDGGTVYFRAYRDGSDSNLSLDNGGTVIGASMIQAETAKAYKLFSSSLGSLSGYSVSVLSPDAPTHIEAGTHGEVASFRELPGIEIQREGDLVVNQEWDLGDISVSAGVLTLRATGDLRIDASIYDAPTTSVTYNPTNLLMYSLFSSYGRSAALSDAFYEETPTWGLNLAAGADLASPDVMDVTQGSGDLTIGTFTVSDQGTLECTESALVYTENAPLNFAAGRDVYVGSTRQPGDTYYLSTRLGISDLSDDLGLTVGTFAGTINGYAGRDLYIQGRGTSTGGVIQSATGDIRIEVERDLLMDLSDGAAIRTTGIAKTLARDPDSALLKALNAQDKTGLIAFVDANSGFRQLLSMFYQAPELYPDADSLREDLIEILILFESQAAWNQETQPYSAYDGGAITLSIGRDLTYRGSKGIKVSDGSPVYWDRVYEYTPVEWSIPADWDETPDFEETYIWAADYTATATAGVATMAGGDLFLRAGGDVQGQIGTFKQGTLSVVSFGDLGGLFQVADGTGVLSAGNVTSHFEESLPDTALSLIRAQVDVMARGDLDLGTAYNPTFVLPPESEYGSQGSLTYSYATDLQDTTLTTALRLVSVLGDVTISGRFARQGNRYAVLPPILEVEAGGDIEIENSLALAPAPLGNLCLTAGGDISGGEKRSRIYVSDLDPSAVYYDVDTLFSTGQALPGQDEEASGMLSAEEITSLLFSPHNNADVHAAEPIHLDDPEPVEIRAGGDINELVLYSPKAAMIRADGDILGLHVISQNLHAEDITSIQAGGILNLSSTVETVTVRDSQATRVGAYYERSGLLLGGPGTFLVLAGETIQLGMTQGIRTTGNALNTGLDAIVTAEEDAPSSLIVISGVDKEFDKEEIWAFFEALQAGGEEYSSLLEEGDTEGASEVVQTVEEEVIQALFEGAELGQGNILMTNSQISTEGTSTLQEHETEEGGRDVYNDSADLYIIALGKINVGLSTIPEPDSESTDSNTGIFTAQGGDINVFSVGDLDVNESRLMTFRGGDILAWSQEGDINAGRGSKTAVSAQPPQRKPVYATNSAGQILWVNVEGDPETPKPRDEWPDDVEIEPVIEAYTIEFSPPAVGSGIRTLTYDPDGAQGPLDAPVLGDAYLFAPSGIIDAGEAGISARNVVLGATEVVNAQNISFTAGSVGVPSSSGGANLGALSGMGGLSETDKLASQTSSMAAERNAAAQDEAKLAEGFVPKWLDVKVVTFDELEEEKEEKEKD